MKKRYTVKKNNNLFQMWDKVDKLWVGDAHISKYRCLYDFDKIKDLPQHTTDTLLSYYARKKLQENPTWTKRIPQTPEERKLRASERIKKRYRKHIEKSRKLSRDKQRNRYSKTKHLRLDKAGLRKRYYNRKKLLNLLQKKIKLELRKLKPKKEYVKAQPKLKICPTCAIEFYGRGNAKWCKPTHAKGALLAKALRKRLGKGSDKRIPPWQDKEELWAFYKACPDGMQVDHIIPLNNEIVCGLHTVNNLQYLSVEDNSRKSNFVDGTANNEEWKILKKKS